MREIMGPLVGAYDLRHSDAHRPSSDLMEKFVLLHVDTLQGRDLLHACVKSLYDIAKVLAQFCAPPPEGSQPGDAATA